jgi:molybdate/tungstate transport system substrate-binding protein
MNRHAFIAAAGAFAAAATGRVAAQQQTVLDVAYAGSMGSMMEGPVKTGVASALQIAMHGRAQGSDALAQLIAGGSIVADVFIPVTATPVRTVLAAQKTSSATPIARTEMVIAYSPKSGYAADFDAAASRRRGAPAWYEILTRPGVRFGRTDPSADPQGRNIIFTLQLAERYYRQPGLANRILGETINAAQIFSEPTVEARLQSGELDAAAAYKIQPGPFGLPYVTLPDEINLGNESLRARYDAATLTLPNGRTYHPEPLVYYAAIISGTQHPREAEAFVRWFTEGEGRSVLRRFAYDPPAGARTLHA